MKKSDFVDYVTGDLFLGVRHIRANPMFGAYGVYRDEVIFALIVDDALYFKTDASNRKEYEKRGAKPVTYLSRGKTVTLPYWQVPADILEDRDLFLEWAEQSYQISAKAGMKKRPVKKPARKKRK